MTAGATGARPIAVSARELEGPPRGVARWLREILGAWRDAGLDRDVTLYVERDLPNDFDAGSFEVVRLGPGVAASATLWEQVTLARALHARPPGVVLGPANTAPRFAGIPLVPVIHDLSFEAHPGWFTRREGFRRRCLARLAALAAERVVVVSTFTASVLAERYGLAPRHITTIANGVSAMFQPITRARAGAAAGRLGVSGEVVLVVGSQFPRRHLREIAEAHALLRARRPHARLVIVGDDRMSPAPGIVATLAAAGVVATTRWLERVSDEDLLALYNYASVCVYLSDYEGFGLPPLEALACGTPVLTSRNTALTANLENVATLLEPDQHSPSSIATALEHLLTTSAPRPEQRPGWLERYSWPRAARTLYDLLIGVA